MPKIRVHPFFQTNLDGVRTNIANGDLGTADTSYTYIYWAAEGFRMGVMQMNIEATTVTLEGTNDPMSTADASATWTDITQTFFGVVNRTTTGDWIIDTALGFGRLRLKRVTTNATNSFQLRLCRIS